MVDGCLEVRIPARSSKAEEARLVEVFRTRYQRSARRDGFDLEARAAGLSRRFDLPAPTRITWVSNQSARWGSCTPSTGVIRLSDRMAGFPPWVIDAVIVHELAHLVEPSHGPRFRSLAGRYPLLERAEGYLLAQSGGTSPDTDPLADDTTPSADPRPKAADPEPATSPPPDPHADHPEGRLF